MTERAEHTAFTPGPWAATTRRGSWDWLVYSVDDPNIEICQPFHDGTEFNEVGEANSKLIAAAPTMLSLLRELIDIEGPCPGNAEWASKVRTAIAAATGEA